MGLAVDGDQNLYVTEPMGSIRKITPAGEVTTIVDFQGPGSQPEVDGTTILADPRSLAIDAAGSLFVVDQFNNVVRKITPDGVMSTVVGVPSSVSGGNVPGPLPGSLVYPAGVAVYPSTGYLAVAVADAILIAGL
jgi:DNA-binding beta-propeller fold protein YncE